MPVDRGIFVCVCVGGGGERERDWERERERENSKTLFHKDCSLGSVKNLTTNPC